MSKLSHIEDVEKRAQEDAVTAYEPAAASEQASVREPQAQPQPHSSHEVPAQRPIDQEMTASEEEAFHGLDAKQPMSAGHKALTIIAAIVVVVTILYIVNSWIHFI